jgi:hypothetical protein
MLCELLLPTIRRLCPLKATLQLTVKLYNIDDCLCVNYEQIQFAENPDHGEKNFVMEILYYVHVTSHVQTYFR